MLAAKNLHQKILEQKREPRDTPVFSGGFRLYLLPSAVSLQIFNPPSGGVSGWSGPSLSWRMFLGDQGVGQGNKLTS